MSIDSLFDAKLEVFERNEENVCGWCKGSGLKYNDNKVNCPYCEGSGMNPSEPFEDDGDPDYHYGDYEHVQSQMHSSGQAGLHPSLRGW